jgi:dUTP pyrophosphatase
MIDVKVVILPNSRAYPLPSYATAGSAGIDLIAAIEHNELLMPGNTKLIPTGLKVEIPEGYEAQVRPRSGLALNAGLTVLNSPGTIDSDYRGEIGVILSNLGGKMVSIKPGMRIAQLVFAPVVQARLIETEDLNSTSRSTGGFGSTGV